MPRRVLFAIRGKLGDTLVAFATVRRYSDAFPEDDVTLLTRAGYAALLAGEKGIRVLGFSSRLSMFALLLKLRFERAFDALLVVWGFGAPIQWIGRLARAKRKIYLDNRFGALFPEFADLSPDRLQSEPMWRVARIFEPALPQPDLLHIPSLAARRTAAPAVIGVAPLADEPRRIMSAQTLANLVRMISIRHPGAPIRVFVNASDRGSAELVEAGLPEGAAFYYFPELEDLLRGFSDLAHLYCTDTGLYHLGAAMGIPATVFYGPTQPWKNMMPAQTGSRAIRLKVLGTAHCEEKACESPACIDGAVRSFSELENSTSLDAVPGDCPLRAFPPAQLTEIELHENPSRQA